MSVVLQPADYVWAGATLVLAVLGLFRGFSGTLAFFLAGLAAAFAGTFGWQHAAEVAAIAEPMWLRAGVVLTGTLLVFGLVRLLVKKTVNGLLAQPTDALFGFAVGAAIGIALLVAWAYSGLALEYSSLATLVAERIGTMGA